MTSLNHPDKLTLDAFSDPNLASYNANGVYNRFTVALKTPVLNAKGIQLMNANFINSSLQLNDNAHLFFFFYASSTQAGIRTQANLRCIRLLPSNYVPAAGYTNYVKNKYFNSGTELVAALNQAAVTGGDSATYNPIWAANQVTFSYDTGTRKVSIQSSLGSVYLAPASANDPFVLDQLRGTTAPGNRITMNVFGGATPLQPYVENVSMNARIGFAMSFLSRPLWSNAGTQLGVATSTGTPLLTTIEADTFPIFLGSQNLSIYLSIVSGSGLDSFRKNLLATIPIENGPLFINSYTTCSIERPALTIPSEIYEVTVEMLDDLGLPFYMPPNFNVDLSLAFAY
jgi:hypothetical protein